MSFIRSVLYWRFHCRQCVVRVVSCSCTNLVYFLCGYPPPPPPPHTHTHTPGLTPASEELQKLKDEGLDIKEGQRDVMSDRIPITDEEIYEDIDSGGDLGLD